MNIYEPLDLGKELDTKIDNQLSDYRDRVYFKIDNQIGSRLWIQLANQLYTQPYNQLDFQIHDHIYIQLVK